MGHNKAKKIESVGDLAETGLVSQGELSDLHEVVNRFQLSITPQMTELMEADGPIARQFVPSSAELRETQEELRDPIGDNPHQKVKGVIHRYPDRCLLIPMAVCPVYCRFCFRREKVGKIRQGLSKAELDAALRYIADHPDIWEVIISGGDPLFMPPKTLGKILRRLSSIPHVEVLRIHTRVPVVDSKRVTDEMIAALKMNKPVYVVLHANHAKEFTPESRSSIAKLVDNGLPMLSQTVLLKGINDNAKELGELMREFVKQRIKPYYLHHTDLAKGTRHFRTSIEEGQAIIKELRGRYSGLCQPTYVLDIPGGHGKVPLHPCYLRKGEENHLLVEDPNGKTHAYSDCHHARN